MELGATLCGTRTARRPKAAKSERGGATDGEGGAHEDKRPGKC